MLNNLNAELEYRKTNDNKQYFNLIKWLNNYFNFLKKERTFNPNYLPVCERGSIVKINLSYLKYGSYALLGQIITLSKIRIIDPIKIGSSLYGIKLSNTTMDKISRKIVKLYF